ncbi:MAG: aldo/keto reductase [Deltaproteobacteria bacterium]|nr:aldo/keto reductase [Deltaproteobacteria bacterium]
MKKMLLGNTGLRVTRLGFGGIPIQRVSEAEAVDAVLHAINKGIDFFDTSRMYSTSEARIGMALNQTDKRVVLATKSMNRFADGIQKDIEVSLKNLRRDYIEIYQCHAVSSNNEYERVTRPNGALEGLIKAKEQGLIGHIGITSHSLDLLEKIIDDGLFETIMVCLSFLEPAAKERIVPKAKEKGIGILAMKPFSGGVIESPEIALKWVLAIPDILVLAGVEDKGLIDQNWQIFEGSYELSREEQETLDAIAREYDNKFCRRCDYCLPCTAGIHIQTMMGIKSYVKRLGPQVLKNMLILSLLKKAAECTECGECMARCPYSLPIPEMIRENLEWVEEYKKGLNI